MNPSITVLMTVYNGGEYLRASVEAVLNQTYRNFEFLIVNDASKDNSLETIASFNDPRIKVVTNPTNLGQTASLNVGLRAAIGQYVARIDADDIAYPIWLEKQVEFISQNPSCAVASMRAVTMDSDGKIIKELNTPAFPQDIILKSIFASPINHVGCLMNREAVLKVGGYNEQYKIVADYGLWCQLIRHQESILTNPMVLVAVRTHAKSISMLEADKLVIPEMTSIIAQQVEFCSQKTLKAEDVMLLWRLLYAGHVMNTHEFSDALMIFKDIYRQWKLESIGFNEIQNFYRKQVKVIFLKRIWGLIKQNKFFSVRESAMLYMKTYGIANVFPGIWFVSFLGKPLVMLANAYEGFLAGKAQQKVIL